MPLNADHACPIRDPLPTAFRCFYLHNLTAGIAGMATGPFCRSMGLEAVYV